MKQVTVLLHGLMRSRFSMIHLAPFLNKAGLNTVALGYPSTRYNLDKSVELLARKLKKIIGQEPAEINFVGHSLGGIVARYFDLKQASLLEPEQSVKRIVMLASPNQGSETARKVLKLRPVANLIGPALKELGELKLPEQTNTAEIGVIAGDIGEFASRLMWTNRAASDGTVTIAETKFAGIKDWIEVRAMHSSIMYSPTVIRETINFLTRGQFARASK